MPAPTAKEIDRHAALLVLITLAKLPFMLLGLALSVAFFGAIVWGCIQAAVE